MFRGLMDEHDPHVSPSQISLHDDHCPRLWWETYRRPTKERIHVAAEMGRLTHGALQDLNLGMGMNGALDPRHIEGVVDKYLCEGASLKWIGRIKGGLESYGERTGGELKDRILLGTEVTVNRNVVINGKTYRVTGIIDLHMRDVPSQDDVIRDHKLGGRMFSSEEVENHTQLNIYAWLLDKKRVWKELHAVLLGYISKPVLIEGEALARVGVYLVGAIKRMLQTVALAKKGIFHEVINEKCAECPAIKKCKAWNEFRRAAGFKAVIPTLKELWSWKQKEAMTSNMLGAIKEAVHSRTVKAGGKMREDGYEAEIKTTEGGLPKSVQGFTTIEEFRSHLTRLPSERLDIRRIS